MCESVGKKIIAWALCFKHQGIFRSNNIFNNDAHLPYFRAQKFPLIVVYNLNPF